MQELAFEIGAELREAAAVLQEFTRRPDTAAKIDEAITRLAGVISRGGCVYSAGNGGSMCDAQHFAEELSGRFRDDRPAIAAAAICDPSHLTCVANDYGFDEVFARFLAGVGRPGDAFLGISTSGNSANIVRACEICRKKGIWSLGLLGKDGGRVRACCDLPIIVPHGGYADRIQEVHTLIIHILIRGIECRLGYAPPAA